jgi:hypothetical protein
MSKRVTLSDVEIEEIVTALQVLGNQGNVYAYEVTKVGRRFYDRLIAKLEGTPQYLCQSYHDKNDVLQDCTCGKCK